MTATLEKYLYGVVRPGFALPRCKGIGGRRLRLVDGDEVAAIVSDVDPPVRAGKSELSTHAAVLQKALDGGTVLPMRFGVVMPDEDAVRDELLDPFAEDLAAQLEDLADRFELHLRATYEEHALMREIVEGDRKIGELSRTLRDASSDATYYARIELGQRVAQAVELAAERDRELVLAELEPLCLAFTVGEPQHERVACDLAFLVERERLADVDAAVDELGRRNDGRMRFSYTGPHPPYGFVELPAEV